MRCNTSDKHDVFLTKKNAFAPLGRVLFCSSLPRAVPTADRVCPFRALVGAKCGEREYAWLGLLEQ